MIAVDIASLEDHTFFTRVKLNLGLGNIIGGNGEKAMCVVRVNLREVMASVGCTPSFL